MFGITRLGFLILFTWFFLVLMCFTRGTFAALIVISVLSIPLVFLLVRFYHYIAPKIVALWNYFEFLDK